MKTFDELLDQYVRASMDVIRLRAEIEETQRQLDEFGPTAVATAKSAKSKVKKFAAHYMAKRCKKCHLSARYHSRQTTCEECGARKALKVSK